MEQQRVTVFGGSGFIGRYVVERLADQGAVVTVAVRDPEKAKFLRPLGQVGQVTPVAANIRDTAALARVVDGADAAIRTVRLGEAVGSRFIVLGGLAPGDLVVVRGNERLRPGQKVKYKAPPGANSPSPQGKVKG